MHITVGEIFYLRRLRKLLERAKRSDILEAVWVINRSSTHRNLHPPHGYHYPVECFSNDYTDAHRVHPWELETLTVELFRVSFREGRRNLAPKSWSAVAALVNALRAVENQQSNHVEGHHILNVMHRLLYRQIVWQEHPKLSPAPAVRWWSIISSDRLRKIFEQRRGVSFQSFIRASLGWNELFKTSSFVGGLVGVPSLGITDEEAIRIADLMSISSSDLEKQARAALSPYNELGYRTNPLRQKPVIRFTDGDNPSYIRPIEQLLNWRITNGLYFDVIADSDSPNLIAVAFESYIKRLIQAKFPDFEIRGEFNYGTAQKPILSPDILVLKEGKLLLVVECKSKKATAAVQLELRSDERLRNEIRELAKGRAQINRFHVAIRGGYVLDFQSEITVPKIVVTLDDWLFWGDQMIDEISRAATDIEQKIGLDISNINPRVEYCNCTEFEEILSRYTPVEILDTFLTDRTPEHRRHRLIDYFMDKFGRGRAYDYPLRHELDQLLGI